MLPISSSVSTFALKAENSFISKCDLIALYDSLVIYSYNGKEDFAYTMNLRQRKIRSIDFKGQHMRTVY